MAHILGFQESACCRANIPCDTYGDGGKSGLAEYMLSGYHRQQSLCTVSALASDESYMWLVLSVRRLARRPCYAEPQVQICDRVGGAVTFDRAIYLSTLYSVLSTAASIHTMYRMLSRVATYGEGAGREQDSNMICL